MMNRRLLIFLSFVYFCFHGVDLYGQSRFPYQNHTLPVDERISDLIGRMTLAEKVSQMLHKSEAIERLDVPAYNWWNEALHGVGRSGNATVFPQAIGMAATFDAALLQRVASVVSDEARAMHHASLRNGHRLQYGGLTFWTPNVNIFRDPRWGRGQETYGEDPYLTSILGTSFVKGLQGDDPVYLKTAACAKHFAVHSGPEKLRHSFDAVSSLYDLHDTYLPAFKSLVASGVESVMCAYNRTNGEACCAHNTLLETILRQQWGFEGHVVSDCWAIRDFFDENGHALVGSSAEAAALALQSGVNLNCGDSYEALTEAVTLGLITEEEIDASLRVLLKTRFKLGMFDPEEEVPFSNLPESVINSDAHRALSREVAQKSIVLLKNDGVLPLKDDLAKYFITGPNAADLQVLLGNYYGVNERMVTFLEGIAGAIAPGSQLQYRKGITLERENINPQDWTTNETKQSDATFVVMGISGLLEGEEGESILSPHFGDRPDYGLPPHQIDFLRKLKHNNPNPVIAIITGGSPMDLAEVHEIADAVILVWYPGQEGGNALADIVFGQVSPSGRLPVTFPKSLDDLPPYEDYAMQGRTYRYMAAEPMYAFGYGLSYTAFAYSDIKTPRKTIPKNTPTSVSVTVTNTGSVASDEVVQLYLSAQVKGLTTPQYALAGVQRIRLAAGESQRVSFDIFPDVLSVVTEAGQRINPEATYDIWIGGSLPDARSQSLGAAIPQKVSLTVR